MGKEKAIIFPREKQRLAQERLFNHSILPGSVKKSTDIVIM